MSAICAHMTPPPSWSPSGGQRNVNSPSVKSIISVIVALRFFMVKHLGSKLGPKLWSVETLDTLSRERYYNDTGYKQHKPV